MLKKFSLRISFVALGFVLLTTLILVSTFWNPIGRTKTAHATGSGTINISLGVVHGEVPRKGAPFDVQVCVSTSDENAAIGQDVEVRATTVESNADIAGSPTTITMQLPNGCNTATFTSSGPAKRILITATINSISAAFNQYGGGDEIGEYALPAVNAITVTLGERPTCTASVNMGTRRMVYAVFAAGDITCTGEVKTIRMHVFLYQNGTVARGDVRVCPSDSSPSTDQCELHAGITGDGQFPPGTYYGEIHATVVDLDGRAIQVQDNGITSAPLTI